MPTFILLLVYTLILLGVSAFIITRYGFGKVLIFWVGCMAVLYVTVLIWL